MHGRLPVPVLHVRLHPARAAGAPDLRRLAAALREDGSVRQHAVVADRDEGRGEQPVLPAGRTRVVRVGGSAAGPAVPPPRVLLAVHRALGELVEAPEGGRGAVQWPVPDRWPVVHAHGAAALRAVWVAAAARGSGARVLAAPTPADGPAAASLWRKAELVAVPDRARREELALRGVGRRRLRIAALADAGAALRLYRRLAFAERRRVQRVDWSVAGARRADADGP